MSGAAAASRVLHALRPTADALSTIGGSRTRIHGMKLARHRFLTSSVELTHVMARACGHGALSGSAPTDVTSWKREVADLVGVAWAGVSAG